MKILFVTSECAPFSKSGGLADVAGSLPPALRDAGDEVAVITPMYQCVKERFAQQLTRVLETTVRLGGNEYYCGLWRGDMNGVTVWFIDNESFFLRPRLYGYDDDKLRFAWFCRAVIALLNSLDFVPEILHCNDWETALAVIYLKNDQMAHEELRRIKTVYTIHNIAYQGQFGANELADTFDLPWGWYDGGLGYEFEGRHDINLMKGAMLMADAVSTVSATYARELHRPEFGAGLQGVADIIGRRMRGILNGIDMDLYDPMKDKRLPYAFSVVDMAGKAKCKQHIQREFGLLEEPKWPLLSVVARLVEQKGIELIKEILPLLMDMGVQMIVYGQGDAQYEAYFEECRRRWPDQFGFSSDYNDYRASHVFAGSDFYLMPSRFEPCGLSQMMAMRYGTVPIVHETGGLKDSVRPYREFDGVGDGFSFSPYHSYELLLAIRQALKVYFCSPDTFQKLRHRCMLKDFSWERSAQRYNRMYAEISDERHGQTLSFEDAYQLLADAYLAVDAENRRLHKNDVLPHYHRTLQITMVGRTHGIISMEFDNEQLHVYPYAMPDADAAVTANFDYLMGMAKGKYGFDQLYLMGQLKITGNLSKVMELRPMLTWPK
ncbi:MAG: glycogen/starch synthase [Clostridia bacterium]|nr:glycogen/starch synthase [Clostridia bacterium]